MVKLSDKGGHSTLMKEGVAPFELVSTKRVTVLWQHQLVFRIFKSCHDPKYEKRFAVTELSQVYNKLID